MKSRDAVLQITRLKSSFSDTIMCNGQSNSLSRLVTNRLAVPSIKHLG